MHRSHILTSLTPSELKIVADKSMSKILSPLSSCIQIFLYPFWLLSLSPLLYRARPFALSLSFMRALPLLLWPTLSPSLLFLFSLSFLFTLSYLTRYHWRCTFLLYSFFLGSFPLSLSLSLSFSFSLSLFLYFCLSLSHSFSLSLFLSLSLSLSLSLPLVQSFSFVLNLSLSYLLATSLYFSLSL